MKVYKIAKGWAIFIYLMVPIMIGVFVWLSTLPFQNGNNLTPNAAWILIPVSVAMITVLIIGVIVTYKGKLVISEDSIIADSSFSIKELKFDEIKGYTVYEEFILVEPKVKGKKRIKISKYTSRYSEILNWFSKNFLDLELQKTIEEEQEILNNETLGWTKELREEKLVKARQVTKVINWAAGIASIWVFFYPTPYQYSILSLIIIPIIAILLVKFSNGLIRIDERKGSAYPSVIIAFLLPSSLLMLRAIMDFEIFDFSNVWFTSIAITLILLLILLFKQKELTFKRKQDFFIVGVLSFLLFAYSYGCVIHYNCIYDKSEAQYYNAKVLSKRISSGKITTRYLELSTWGKQTEIDEVSVDKSLYNRIEVGDEVNIYYRNGRLEIPWIIVSDK